MNVFRMSIECFVANVIERENERHKEVIEFFSESEKLLKEFSDRQWQRKCKKIENLEQLKERIVKC